MQIDEFKRRSFSRLNSKPERTYPITEPDSGDLEEIEILLLPELELVKALGEGKVATVGAATIIGLAMLARSGSLPVSSASLREP